MRSAMILRFSTLTFLTLIVLCLVTQSRSHEANQELVNLLQSSITGRVFPKGTYGYAKRRIVHNGLCSHIYPDIIVTPHTTEDVSAIIKIARAHGQVISVRSGGHSFTCTSLKQGKKQGSLRVFMTSSFKGEEGHRIL